MRRDLVSFQRAAIPLLLVLLGPAVSQGAIQFDDWISQPNFNMAGVQVRLMRNDAGGGQLNTWGNGTGGGEFRVDTLVGGNWEMLEYSHASATDWIYKTFCLERNEFISIGTAYNVTIDDAAWYGRNLRPGNTSPEPVTPASQLLYGLYFEGRLDSESGMFVYNNNAWADDLQRALWNLEDITTYLGNAAALVDWANNHLDLLDTLGGEVKVLNLWQGTPYVEGHEKQSQFIYSPVPEPASVAIWSVIGLIGVGAGWRRRRRR